MDDSCSAIESWVGGEGGGEGERWSEGWGGGEVGWGGDGSCEGTEDERSSSSSEHSAKSGMLLPHCILHSHIKYLSSLTISLHIAYILTWDMPYLVSYIVQTTYALKHIHVL